MNNPYDRQWRREAARDLIFIMCLAGTAWLLAKLCYPYIYVAEQWERDGLKPGVIILGFLICTFVIAFLLYRLLIRLLKLK